jgi:uncharacterized membrane protein
LLDPLHPPLAREAIALPLYLAGERLTKSAESDLRPGHYTAAGNAILYGSGHYTRNLLLARSGILPFLCVAILCVFFWTKRLFGTFAACIAVFLFSTLPSVLAFSGLAYTDLPAMCTQFACLFAFAIWLDDPTAWRTLLLGIAGGLAISSKFTSFVFLPAAGFAMLLVKCCLSSAGLREWSGKAIVRLAAAAALAFVILWGSYGFSIGHLQQSFEVSPDAIPWLASYPRATQPSFEHFPGPLRNAALRLWAADPTIPVPDLIRGVQEARLLKSTAPASYLYGDEENGGSWFFFPVAIALKTPIAFLILAVAGCVSLFLRGKLDWAALMPAAAAAAIFVVTAFITYKVGTRHLLVVFPLLSVLAGAGAATLWSNSQRNRHWGQVVLCLLLAWQVISTVRAQSDVLAYFNELAPRDSSRALVKGCDLDCGQDVLKLSRDLQERNVTHVSLAMWGTADMTRLGFPSVEVLRPNQPVTGWLAVSVRTLRTGQLVVIDKGIQYSYFFPHGSLSWLDRYQPIERVGKTLLLYYISPKPELNAHLGH